MCVQLISPSTCFSKLADIFIFHSIDVRRTDDDEMGIPLRASYQNDIWHTSVQIDVRTLPALIKGIEFSTWRFRIKERGNHAAFADLKMEDDTSRAIVVKLT